MVRLLSFLFVCAFGFFLPYHSAQAWEQNMELSSTNCDITLLQAASTPSFQIGADGTYTNLYGTSGTCSNVASVKIDYFTDSGSGGLTAAPLQFAASNCTITYKNQTTSPSPVTFSSGTQNVNIGGTFEFDGICDPGDYEFVAELPFTSLDNPSEEITTTHHINLHLSATLSVSQVQSLSFGSVIPMTSDGSVTITPRGGIIQNGVRVRATYIKNTGVSLLRSGIFQVTGVTGANVKVSIPASVYLYNTTDASQTMLVDNFVMQQKDGTLPSTIINLTEENTQVYVGATLHVKADQADGKYTGVLPITVNYE